MTDAVFVPTGRPVLRFVSVMGVVVVALAGLSWTGAVAPHVDAHLLASTFDNPRQSGTVTISVHNRGPAPAYVLRITSGNRYVHVVSTRGAAGKRVEDPHRVSFFYRFDCSGFAPRPDLDIHLHVRGVIGPGRTLRVPSDPPDAMCFVGRPSPPLP